MTGSEQAPTHREQPWREDDVRRGHVVVLSANPISAALAAIGEAVGYRVTVISEDDGGPGLSLIVLEAGDAVVLCDHDAPDAPAVLRAALASDASYVAMMASRRRAEGLLGDLGAEGVPGLEKLHVPAGHNLGGRGPGEIALSVMAEIVAEAHGRPGGPMRGPR
ncbi:MAG: Xanthine and dehydrogenase maturation factor, XdhC/CoxF family [Pseudonocardiales bacterium]|nr:Xanthine and dehydrogenase maturation factor, XdhC/CoxF family [Pseudonocardiales bacterium]